MMALLYSYRHFDFKCHTATLRKLLDCKYFGSLFLRCCFDGEASLIKKVLSSMTNTMLWNIQWCVHWICSCIHVFVVPHQLTCRRCTEFNYVSAAPDYMVRKKIRQKVARQWITSIVMLWTNLQHLKFFVAEKFFW